MLPILSCIVLWSARLHGAISFFLHLLSVVFIFAPYVVTISCWLLRIWIFFWYLREYPLGNLLSQFDVDVIQFWLFSIYLFWRMIYPLETVLLNYYYWVGDINPSSLPVIRFLQNYMQQCLVHICLGFYCLCDCFLD